MAKMQIVLELKKILKENEERYYVDGVLNKAKVIEDLHNYDFELITLLSESEIIKKYYLTEINGVKIIRINELIEIFELNEYWNNSYTNYENKIGLTSDKKFISENSEVVLDFPYKDTVLKATMSKEEKEKEDLLPNEPFYNEKIAREEIEVLFDNKILKNAKKYSSEGVNKVTKFSENDNLIIKGNNLIALHSLKDKFAGKVKLIYIDPPYNTGSDSFRYNDHFNRSTWLTFMKNRLEIARDLLSEDGSIYLQLDYNQVHYAKVLMDEIFGEDNFQREIIWRIGWVSGYKTAINNYIRNHDTILFYSKNNEKVFFNKEYIPNEKLKNLVKREDIKKLVKELDIENNKIDDIYEFINYTNRPKRYPIEDLWNSNEYDDLNSIAIVSFSGESVSKMLDVKEVKGQKSEKLLQRIISASTEQGDIVLDFFMGTATTQAVAHKMNRQYIGIEQLDYIEDTSVPRLKKVIDGDQSGISKDVNWHGGGSFIYAELMEKNTGYLKDVLNAESTDRLREIFILMLEYADFDFRVDLEEVKDSFWRLPLEDQKRILVKIIDKNQLYYNYSEIDDDNVRDLISDSDYDFNKIFYDNTGDRDE